MFCDISQFYERKVEATITALGGLIMCMLSVYIFLCKLIPLVFQPFQNGPNGFILSKNCVKCALFKI